MCGSFKSKVVHTCNPTTQEAGAGKLSHIQNYLGYIYISYIYHQWSHVMATASDTTDAEPFPPNGKMPEDKGRQNKDNYHS